MLKTENYKDQILELYDLGFSGREIQQKLNFKNHQPIYNFFKKYGLTHPERRYTKKYTLDINYFKKINTEEKAYILGFICADAHVSKYRMKITLAEKDKELLIKIKKALKTNVSITYSERPNPHNSLKICKLVSIDICGREFTKHLIDKGITSNKTYTLNSSILKYLPSYLISHFLRGYFDGDGNVLYGKKYASGTKYNINICGNKEFLLNTYQKYFPSTNKLYFAPKSKQMYVWKISSKKQVFNFLEYLYSNSSIRLNRKYKIYLKSKHAHIKPL